MKERREAARKPIAEMTTEEMVARLVEIRAILNNRSKFSDPEGTSALDTHPQWFSSASHEGHSHSSGYGLFIRSDMEYRGTDGEGTPRDAVITPKTKK